MCHSSFVVGAIFIRKKWQLTNEIESREKWKQKPEKISYERYAIKETFHNRLEFSVGLHHLPSIYYFENSNSSFQVNGNSDSSKCQTQIRSVLSNAIVN